MLRHPLRVALARHQEAASQIIAHDGVEAFLADLGERRRELAAGVVDEMIDARKTRQDAGDRLPDFFLLADVADESLGLAARRGDFRLHGMQLVGRAADERDPRAECRELMRRAAADAAAAAGDDRHLPGKQARPEHRSVALLGRQVNFHLVAILFWSFPGWPLVWSVRSKPAHGQRLPNPPSTGERYRSTIRESCPRYLFTIPSSPLETGYDPSF